MFENKKIHISEMQSVIYVKPSHTAQKRIYYGPRLMKYELIYKLTGESVTTFGGKIMHNTPGTVEFLPKCENTDYYVDRIKLGDCFDIFFDTDSPMPTDAFVVNAASNINIKVLFNKIYQLWITRQDGYYYKCMALFYEILAELTKPHGNNISKDKYKKIEKGIDYLHTHCFDKDIDYYMPSALCQISYTYFKRLFIQKFGITPIKYVAKLRMERAAELLATARYTVTEVAEICGFENVYYFSTVFKKHFGVSPKNYIFL
ncbi:MAG: AraC family transcriptional regulator [Eubacteriales bacterium]|nr:AraC family transcriptional regulator [Eubacteriales bacterium]